MSGITSEHMFVSPSPAAIAGSYVHAMEGVDEPVSLRDYDPTWPVQFTREESRLREALAGVLLGIEHIGSTAVPGLTAKPSVDVMVGVAASEHRDTVAGM